MLMMEGGKGPPSLQGDPVVPSTPDPPVAPLVGAVSQIQLFLSLWLLPGSPRSPCVPSPPLPAGVPSPPFLLSSTIISLAIRLLRLEQLRRNSGVVLDDDLATGFYDDARRMEIYSRRTGQNQRIAGVLDVGVHAEHRQLRREIHGVNQLLVTSRLFRIALNEAFARMLQVSALLQRQVVQQVTNVFRCAYQFQPARLQLRRIVNTYVRQFAADVRFVG